MEPSKERPILFSAPMVRAILEGRKTQTRRVVKRGQVFRFCPGGDLSREERSRINASLFRWERENPAHPTMDELLAICPYGVPGGRLWVRETWRRPHNNRDTPITRGQSIQYRASSDWHDGFGDHWRPSIHMPRWASRLTLEVVSVRVERLLGMTEADAQDEGVADPHEFSELWTNINGEGSWEKNPWVWVVEFRRVQGDTLAVIRGGE